MPLVPDYQSPNEQRVARQPKQATVAAWLTTLGCFASAAALFGSLIISGGIIEDEKVAFVGLLFIASALNVTALGANIKFRYWGGTIMTVLSVAALGVAFVYTARAWR